MIFGLESNTTLRIEEIKAADVHQLGERLLTVLQLDDLSLNNFCFLCVIHLLYQALRKYRQGKRQISQSVVRLLLILFASSLVMAEISSFNTSSLVKLEQTDFEQEKDNKEAEESKKESEKDDLKFIENLNSALVMANTMLDHERSEKWNLYREDITTPPPELVTA